MEELPRHGLDCWYSAVERRAACVALADFCMRRARVSLFLHLFVHLFMLRSRLRSMALAQMCRHELLRVRAVAYRLLLARDLFILSATAIHSRLFQS